MSSSNPLKRCCLTSTQKGVSACPICGSSLWPDDVTVVKIREETPERSEQRATATSDRVWVFRMIAACLIVFAAIVTADYFVQRKAAQDALARAQPTPAMLKTPDSAPSSSREPTPIASPSAKPEIDLSAGLVESADPAPSPTATVPDFDDWKRGSAPEPSPKSTARTIPQTEVVVSARDVLRVDFQKREDSRRYRFTLAEKTRIRGSFSAIGGGVTVRIFSTDATVYVSGFSVSGDSIDVELPRGSYELLVMLVGTESQIVSFNVNVSATYRGE